MKTKDRIISVVWGMGEGKTILSKGREHSKAQSYQKSIGFPGTSKDFVVFELRVLSGERPKKDEASRLTVDATRSQFGFCMNNVVDTGVSEASE